MTKRETAAATRKLIVEKTATLLNTTGYVRTSMSDVMRVTGLTKGGLYHHFQSRDDLLTEAFQYAVGLVCVPILKVIKSDTSARDKLLALIATFESFPVDDVLRSGCPIVNLAIESDNVHPELREAGRSTMATLTRWFQTVIEEGLRSGEFGARDPRTEAAHMVAALEGGLILTTVYKDPVYLRAVAESLGARVRAGLT